MSITLDEKIVRGLICPYCNCPTKMVTDREIHGPRSNFNRTFIQCIENNDHYVGTFANGRALGRLANADLRKLKMKAHSLFDPLWKEPIKIFRTRDRAYRWLANEMNLTNYEMHFGMFDDHQCNQAIGILTAFIKAHNKASKHPVTQF